MQNNLPINLILKSYSETVIKQLADDYSYELNKAIINSALSKTPLLFDLKMWILCLYILGHGLSPLLTPTYSLCLKENNDHRSKELSLEKFPS